LCLKKYILIYVYNNLSAEELEFWEQTNLALLNKGYTLFLLMQIVPKCKVGFLYAKFTERLDDVIFPNKFAKKDKRFDFTPYLQRENIWYGSSDRDRLTAAKCQKYKYTKLIQELNPTLLVLGNGQHASDIILKDIAIKNNTPILYIERGSLPKSWHLDSLGMTAGSEVAKKTLNELYQTNSKKYVSYSNYYLESKSTWWKQPINDNPVNIKNRFGLETDQKLILFANQLDNDTSNFLYNPFFNSNILAFEWFCRSFIASNLDGFVLVKKHPHYKGDEHVFQNVLKKYSITGAWVDDIALFDCIEQADLVCAVNSTMLFESLIYKKPVLQLGDSLLNNKDIVYKLESETDFKTLQSWYNKVGLEERLINYTFFMSYLIDNELTFFFKGAKEMEFNSIDFFVQKLLKHENASRFGNYPKKFMKLNNYKPKTNIQKQLLNIIKRGYNKIHKFIK